MARPEARASVLALALEAKLCWASARAPVMVLFGAVAQALALVTELFGVRALELVKAQALAVDLAPAPVPALVLPGARALAQALA
jgi:hypothetical protein